MFTDKSRSLQGIAVTLLLCAAILVFCSIPIAAKTSLTLSCWSKEEYWQPLIDRFESEYPNIEIELFQRPQKQYFDVVFTMLAGGAAPDLILSNPQYAPLFVAGGQWLDLGPYITRDRFDFSQYLEPGWAYGRFNGTVYAWPAGIDPPFANHLFAYNRDYFQAAGVAEPDAKWTFDDWLAMAKKLTIDENSDGVPEVYGTGQPTRNWWWNLVWSNGGRVFSDDKKQFRMIEHNATEALQFAYDLNLVHGVSGNAYYKDFHAGKAAIVNIPVAHTLGWLQQNPTSFDWGVTGYPRGAKAESSMVRAGDLPLGINSASPHREEAWTFLKWMVREDVQRWATFDVGILSAPVHKKVALSTRFLRRSNPPYDLTPIVMQGVRFLPVFTGWADVDALVQAALLKAEKGEVSVAAALAEIAGPVEAILAQH